MENPYELLYMRRQGDEWARRELIRQYTPLMKSEFAKLLTAHPQLSRYMEDFLQEGALAVEQAADSYREDQNAGWMTFLTTVIHNRYLSLTRHLTAKTYVQIHDTLALETMVAEPEGYYQLLQDTNRLNDPVFHFYYNEACGRYNRLLKELTPADIRVLETYLDCVSYKEAAERLGISVKSFEGKVLRLRKKVKSVILPDDEE